MVVIASRFQCEAISFPVKASILTAENAEGRGGKSERLGTSSSCKIVNFNCRGRGGSGGKQNLLMPYKMGWNHNFKINIPKMAITIKARPIDIMMEPFLNGGQVLSVK